MKVTEGLSRLILPEQSSDEDTEIQQEETEETEKETSALCYFCLLLFNPDSNRMTDCFILSPFEFFVRRTRTRFPFRYGIASMTEVPHLFARTTVTVGGKSSVGLSSEGLPPKWFTKNPATTFEQDLPEMLEVISHAAKLSERIARSSVSFFDFWQELYRQQSDWANARHIAPLLAN